MWEINDHATLKGEGKFLWTQKNRKKQTTPASTIQLLSTNYKNYAVKITWNILYQNNVSKKVKIKLDCNTSEKAQFLSWNCRICTTKITRSSNPFSCSYTIQGGSRMIPTWLSLTPLNFLNFWFGGTCSVGVGVVSTDCMQIIGQRVMTPWSIYEVQMITISLAAGIPSLRCPLVLQLRRIKMMSQDFWPALLQWSNPHWCGTQTKLKTTETESSWVE